MSFPYPSYVICIDGEPLEETNGSVTLYNECSERDLIHRFMAIVYLIEDSSRLTIKKFRLTPHSFESEISKEEFLKKARETKEVG